MEKDVMAKKFYYLTVSPRDFMGAMRYKSYQGRKISRKRSNISGSSLGSTFMLAIKESKSFRGKK